MRHFDLNMVSKDMRMVMRRSRRPADITRKQYKACKSVYSKSKDIERIRQEISRKSRQQHTNVGGDAQQMTLDSIHKHKLFRHDDDTYAAYVLNHCVDEIRSMYTDAPAQTKDCGHSNMVEDTRNGSDVCTDCGNVTSRLIFETSTMDGILQGTSSVVTKHVYKRKNYFLSHLRNLFGQTRSRPVPWMIELWAIRQEYVTSGNDMLLAMKQAPKYVRSALRLPRYYKHAHRLYRDTHCYRRRKCELRSDVEDMLMCMFDGCLHAFTCVRQKHNRSSFLNKHYVMRQLMVLANVDRQLLDTVPRMQMECKNREHDHIWKDMCHIMHWPVNLLADHKECCLFDNKDCTGQ